MGWQTLCAIKTPNKLNFFKTPCGCYPAHFPLAPATAPDNKVGCRYSGNAKLAQHGYYLPTVIRAMVEQVQQHLENRLLELFFL